MLRYSRPSEGREHTLESLESKLKRWRLTDNAKGLAFSFHDGERKHDFAADIRRLVLDLAVRVATLEGLDYEVNVQGVHLHGETLSYISRGVSKEYSELLRTVDQLISVNTMRLLGAGQSPEQIAANITFNIRQLMIQLVEMFPFYRTSIPNDDEGLSVYIAVSFISTLLRSSLTFVARPLTRAKVNVGTLAQEKGISLGLAHSTEILSTRKHDFTAAMAAAKETTSLTAFWNDFITDRDREEDMIQRQAWEEEYRTRFPKRPFAGHKEAYMELRQLRNAYALEDELLPYIESFSDAMIYGSTLPEVQYHARLDHQDFYIRVDQTINRSALGEGEVGGGVLALLVCQRQPDHDPDEVLVSYVGNKDFFDVQIDYSSGVIFPCYTSSVSMMEHRTRDISKPSFYSMMSMHPGGLQAAHRIFTPALQAIAEGYLSLVELRDVKTFLKRVGTETETMQFEETDAPQEEVALPAEEEQVSPAPVVVQPEPLKKRKSIRANGALYDLEEQELYVMAPLTEHLEATTASKTLFLELTGEELPEGMCLNRIQWKNKRPRVTWPDVVAILKGYFDVELDRYASSSHVRYRRIVDGVTRKANLMHKRETAMIGTLRGVLADLGIPEPLFWIAYSHMGIATGKGLSPEHLKDIADIYAREIGLIRHGVRQSDQ